MFGKFMNKKFFHPQAYHNVKAKWVHEQRSVANKKNEAEKQATYQKEQETYQSRLLSAKTNSEKIKCDLNFMYDVPPGLEKQENEEDKEEVEVRFEWQKNAPRSKYITDLGLECQDQPFGVCVRNTRCFKCRAWGHQNTDRECPLYFSNINSEANVSEETEDKQVQSLRLSDPLRLVAEMKKQHGITLKKSVIGQEIDPMAENQQLLESDEENGDLGPEDLAYIESLSDKQKRKLLKRLNKLEKKSKKQKKKDKQSDDSKTTQDKHKTTHSNSSSDEEDRNFKRRRKRKQSSSDNSDQDEEHTFAKDFKRERTSEYDKRKFNENKQLSDLERTHKHRKRKRIRSESWTSDTIERSHSLVKRDKKRKSRRKEKKSM